MEKTKNTDSISNQIDGAIMWESNIYLKALVFFTKELGYRSGEILKLQTSCLSLYCDKNGCVGSNHQDNCNDDGVMCSHFHPHSSGAEEI